MAVRTVRSDKWVRAFVGNVAIVDSLAPLLYYEENFPVPGYAFEKADVRTDLLQHTTAQPPVEPFFFLPKGPVAQWFDLEVDGRSIRHVAWARDTPELAGLLILSWQPGLLDRWLEEEEEVGGHPRDPYKRVDALASSRHIVVGLDGVTLAESDRPVLLFETGLPTRYYLDRSAVDFSHLRPSATGTSCPYKGRTSEYWSIEVGDEIHADLAWTYDFPTRQLLPVAGMVAFYNEKVDVFIDGVEEQRPKTHFFD